MTFRTKLDYSDNRQIRQTEKTHTILSGGTAFGLSFSALTTGPDPELSGVSLSQVNLVSTFSGNTGTTVYTWFDSNMSLGESAFSALTASNSGITQNTGMIFTPSSTTIIDGNTVALAYTGVTFDISVIAMVDMGGGAVSGSVFTANFDSLSAETIDYTGRTIWVDVSGITRTQDLIITDNPVVDYVWTCLDTEGRGFWASGGTAFSGTGYNSFIFGADSKASGTTAVAMGNGANADGDYSNATGNNTTASGNASNASNDSTVASGGGAHAEGNSTTASGNSSHSEGGGTLAASDFCHAEGQSTSALFWAAHAEGDSTTASAFASHAEGDSTIASGDTSHSEGTLTTALGNYSHAGGILSKTYNTGEWARSSSGVTAYDQYGTLSYAITTNGAVLTEIFVGGGGTGSERMLIPNNSARYCRIYATAIETTSTTGGTKQFLGDGLIKNITGTTSLVGVLTMTSTYGDTALAGATMTVTADNVNDSLKIQVTGIAATTINWFVRLDYEQVQI